MINSKFEILNPKQAQSSNVQNLSADRQDSKQVVLNFRFWVLNLFRILCLGFWILSMNSYSFADSFLESVLKDGIGVRPLGMGGAFVALSDDSSAIYYNPAALSTMGTSYIREYMDMNSDFYIVNEGYTLAANQGGLSYWTRWDKNYNKASVTAFAFGTGAENGVSWGLTSKNIAWSLPATLGDNRGWSLDVGLKMPLLKELTAGVLLQDFLRTNIEVPTSVRLGLSFIPSIIRDTSINADGELRNLKSPTGPLVYMHYGAETKLSEGLVLRGGWQKDHFTAGASVAMPLANIDYAVIINKDDKNLHMFSFRFKERK